MAKNVTYRLRLLIVAMLVAVSANAQQLGLKTNLLYWATTTPNVGLELQTGRKHSVQAFYGIMTLTDFTLHFSCCFTNLLHSHFVSLLNNFTMQEKCY